MNDDDTDQMRISIKFDSRTYDQLIDFDQRSESILKPTITQQLTAYFNKLCTKSSVLLGKRIDKYRRTVNF